MNFLQGTQLQDGHSGAQKYDKRSEISQERSLISQVSSFQRQDITSDQRGVFISHESSFVAKLRPDCLNFSDGDYETNELFPAPKDGSLSLVPIAP